MYRNWRSLCGEYRLSRTLHRSSLTVEQNLLTLNSGSFQVMNGGDLAQKGCFTRGTDEISPVSVIFREYCGETPLVQQSHISLTK